MMSKVYWDDFDIEGSGTDVLRGNRETYIGRVVEEPRYNPTTVAMVVGATGVLAVIGTVMARGGLESLKVRRRRSGLLW